MTNVRDFTHAIFAEATVRPQAVTANTTGLAVPVGRGGGNTLALYLSVGAVSGTSPTLTVVVEAADSATATTWTPVVTLPIIMAGNQLVTQYFLVPPAPTISTEGHRFVRARLTVGGTSPSFLVSALVVGMLKHPQPGLGAMAGAPTIN